MLRWCQATVRTLDGICTGIIETSSRVHSEHANRGRVGPSRTVHNARRASSRLVAEPTVDLWRRIGSTAEGPTESQERAKSLVPLETRVVDDVLTTEDAPAPASGHSSQAAMLKGFLASTTPTTPKLSAHRIITLYHSLKSENQLHHLSSKDFTQLITLLGTLSLPSPLKPCIYLSNLLPRVTDQPTDPGTHWSLVLEIAKDKEHLSKLLTGTDRYWLMRAHLARALSSTDEPFADTRRLHALSQATFHYHRIWRHTPDPEIHVPYFEAFLFLSTEESAPALVSQMSKVLELHARPHSRITDVFWRGLLKHGHAFSSEQKERVLTMVHGRLGRWESGEKQVSGSGKRHKVAPVTILDLSSSLGNAVFPNYSSANSVPAEVRQWAVAQASKTFSPTVTQDLRWGSLLLLGIHKSPTEVSQGVIPDVDMGPNSIEWRTVFLLAILEQILGSVDGLIASEARQEMQDFVQSIWRTWRDAGLHTPRPVSVTATIVATFFRAASKSADVSMVQKCFRFCVANQLFTLEGAPSHELCVAYILAATTSGERSLREALSSLELSSSARRQEVFEALLRHHLRDDPVIAHEVFCLGKKHDVGFSTGVVHRMSLALATSRTWHLAIPLLNHLGFSRVQLEELVGAILSVFREERREYIGSAQARDLGDAMWKLYAHHIPSKRLKYPIRFFFQIMIASGSPARAISIVEAIHRQVPDFFTTRLFLRLARTLVRFRHIDVVPRIVALAPEDTRAGDDLRRKVVVLLSRAGAHSKAGRVAEISVRLKGRQTTRESMVRAVRFNVKKPSAFRSLRVVSLLARKPVDGRSVKYAIQILVRAGRSSAARKLLERVPTPLDPATMTTIGNIILHGPLKQHDLRNGRLIRHLLRTKDLLEKRYSFRPDRTTTNILVKSVLRWREVIDPPRIRALFDHMVRCGYPASSQWFKENDVPFGTPLSTSGPPAWGVSKLPGALSFEKHVRPMYKMFVKALYAREDVRGAKVVLGILKEEEVQAVRRREERNQARKEGLVRKMKRERDGRK